MLGVSESHEGQAGGRGTVGTVLLRVGKAHYLRWPEGTGRQLALDRARGHGLLAGVAFLSMWRPSSITSPDGVCPTACDRAPRSLGCTHGRGAGDFLPAFPENQNHDAIKG